MSKMPLRHRITEQGVEFRIFHGLMGKTELPLSSWSEAVVGDVVKSLLLNWAEQPEIIKTETSLTVPFDAIANLETTLATRLGLPPDVSFILDLQHQGTVDQPELKLIVNWLGPTQQHVWGIHRTGCFLHKGQNYYRLNGFLYPFLQALEEFNVTAGGGEPRLAALAKVMQHLPEGWHNGVHASQYLQRLKIIPVGAFSLNLRTENGRFAFTPVLYNHPYSEAETAEEDMSDGLDNTARQPQPALTPHQQTIFSEQRFRQFEQVCPFYALDQGTFVVLGENVCRALGVVREALNGDEDHRLAFAVNPRAKLKEKLGHLSDNDVIESWFIEPQGYMNWFIGNPSFLDRIVGLGIYKKRNLPWVQREGEQWLPDGFSESADKEIIINGHKVALTAESKTILEEQAYEARNSGQTHIDWQGKKLPVDETIEKIQTIIGRTGTVSDQSAKTPQATLQPSFLLIRDNFDVVEYERSVNTEGRKITLQDCLPATLKTELHPHQREGLLWLQKAWRTGLPGVLLADDMGLGKSLQALAFLAWLKQGMTRKAPFLLVAPTGLLKNWQAEHVRHLDYPGLGDIVEVYGSKIRQYRRIQGRDIEHGGAGLDTQRLQQDADVVLTTYETLRDYHHSFAAMRFAVAMFDEMQKVKTPSTQLTDAAQVVNADFILGLTGTPVENRLADLWCIYDTIAPGFLGGLKDFSQRYERSNDGKELFQLKDQLTKYQGSVPPIMLRRMKEAELKGLPQKKIYERPVAMSAMQAEEYDRIVHLARSDSAQGAMIAVLQKLARVSLSHHSPHVADSKELANSARITELWRILDHIAERHEKALVFIDLKDWQERLAAEIKQRYKLQRLPCIINGDKSPLQRQKFVDEFQSAGRGFDVMLLGPKAGGVGLTLTAANHVVHLNRWWNPAIEDQSTDRVYRIGQEKEVYVYYPIAEHPVHGRASFDWRLHGLLEKKRKLSHDILMPPISTQDDIKEVYQGIMETSEEFSDGFSIGDIDRMGGKEFEKWVATCLQQGKFNVNLTPASHDGKTDIMAWRSDGLCLLIQCKQTSNYKRPCQADVVGELLTARRLRDKPSALLVGITNAVSFSRSQREQATQEGIILLCRNDLGNMSEQLIKELPPVRIAG